MTAPLRASDADLAMVRDTLVRGDLSAEGAQNLYPRHASLLLGEVMFLRRQVADARQALAALPITLEPSATLPEAITATQAFYQDYQDGLWQQQEVAKLRKTVQRRTEERDQHEHDLQECRAEREAMVAAMTEARQQWLSEKAGLETLLRDSQRIQAERAKRLTEALNTMLADEIAAVAALIEDHQRQETARTEQFRAALAGIRDMVEGA